MSFFAGAEAHTALIGRSPYRDQIRARLARTPKGTALPVDDAWIDEFAVAGNAERVRAGLRALLDAGADSLGIWLFPAERLTRQLERIAADVLPWHRGKLASPEPPVEVLDQPLHP